MRMSILFRISWASPLSITVPSTNHNDILHLQTTISTIETISTILRGEEERGGSQRSASVIPKIEVLFSFISSQVIQLNSFIPYSIPQQIGYFGCNFSWSIDYSIPIFSFAVEIIFISQSFTV
jgi:hypothetical protein